MYIICPFYYPYRWSWERGRC